MLPDIAYIIQAYEGYFKSKVCYQIFKSRALGAKRIGTDSRHHLHPSANSSSEPMVSVR